MRKVTSHNPINTAITYNTASAISGRRARKGKKAGPLWLNALLFHGFWLVCVLGSEWLSVIALFVWGFIHHRYFIFAKREWVVIAMVSASGIALDNAILGPALIHFNPGQIDNPLHFIGRIPFWLALLWVGFSMTIMHCFYWLADRLALASILGLLVVPVSYYTGAQLSDATIVTPSWRYVLSEGILWAILLPAGLQFAKIIDNEHHWAMLKKHFPLSRLQ